MLAVSRNATESMAIEVLADLLPRFVMEARRGRLVKEVCEHAGFSGVTADCVQPRIVSAPDLMC